MYVKIEGHPFIVEMMYARTDNMVSRAVYDEIGWGNLAVVHEDVWQCLQKAIPVLNKFHYKIKICDAYRPPLAHHLMKSIVPMKGFFAADAAHSQHCHATAVDVCLCDEAGKELAYPTLVDAYRPDFAKEIAAGNSVNFKRHLLQARHDYKDDVDSECIKNRVFLRKLMEYSGLLAINHEWWHYDLPQGKSEKYPLVNLNPQEYR